MNTSLVLEAVGYGAAYLLVVDSALVTLRHWWSKQVQSIESHSNMTDCRERSLMS